MKEQSYLPASIKISDDLCHSLMPFKTPSDLLSNFVIHLFSLWVSSLSYVQIPSGTRVQATTSMKSLCKHTYMCVFGFLHSRAGLSVFVFYVQSTRPLNTHSKLNQVEIWPVGDLDLTVTNGWRSLKLSCTKL